MVATELARLRDPAPNMRSSASGGAGSRWLRATVFCCGIRPGGPTREAVVLGPGWSGGCASEDVPTLEWIATAPGNAPEMPIQRIPVSTLADCDVRRADWTDERLRDAGTGAPAARAQRSLSARLQTGRRRWRPLALDRDRRTKTDVSRDGRRTSAGLAQVVHFEGQLVGRTAGKEEKEDSFTVQVLWRSDGASCGRMLMSFGMLTGGGVRRTFQDDEAEREREALKRKQELEERREILRQRGPHWSMTRKLP